MRFIRNPMNLLTILGLLLAGIVSAGTVRPALAQDPDPAPTVRFVHVYAGGGPVDVYLDDDLVVEQLAFGTATEYATTDDGDRRIRVVATGGALDSALIDTTFSPEQGAAYNILIGGQGENLDARVYEVDLDAVEPGQARVRFVQASPDSGDVDFELAPPATGDAATDTSDTDTTTDVSGETNDTLNEDGVGYGDAGDYQTVRAATYDVIVRQAGADTVLIQAPSVALESGMVYDIVALGSLEANNLTLLPLMTSVMLPCSELLGVGETTDGCARFIHTSVDAGAVDVLINGTVVVQGISYGTATEFSAFPAGEHQVQIVPTGQGAEGAVIDETINVTAGQAYQFAVLGNVTDDDNGDNDLRLSTSEIDLTPLPADQARIRVVHAVADAGEVSLSLISGTPLFENIAFGDAEQYAVIDAGTYDLVVSDPDDAPLVTGEGTALDAGMVYDVFVIGRASDGSLQLLILTSNAIPREGAQGTPLAIPAVTEQAGEEPVDATDATVISGGEEQQASPTPVGAAPVTPVLTPEATATP